MYRALMFLAGLLIVGCGSAPEQRAAESVTPPAIVIGQALPDFELSDFDGQATRLSDLMDGQHYTVVVFHSPTCPCARNCAAAIAEHLTPEAYPDVRFIGVLPDSNWDVDWMRSDLEEQQRAGVVSFPVVIDRDQAIMTSWGVERTPTVFLADKEGRLRYWGAPESTLEPFIDGYEFLLKDALDALRAGRQPAVTHYDSIGCLIAKRQES